jgi:hypothetical protein
MSNQLQVSGEAKIRAIQGPVVANSGVITALDGDASEYVRGDGTLADFPTSTGGGSAVSYYLNTSVSQGTIGGVAYKQLSKTPISGAGTDVTISANGYIASYITDANDPALLEVPAGNFNCEFYFSVNSNSHNPYVYAEVYKYDGTTFTLLGSNVSIPQYLSNGTTLSPYYFAIAVSTAVLTVTDRIAIRIYVNVDGRTVTLHTENNHLCQVVTTFSKGLISLNNLTRQNQFFATGTSGTDFAISSATATHTFNLPVASATNTGKLSSTDWSTFNGKVPYTGAIANLDLGAYSLFSASVGANFLYANGASPVGGYISLKQGDATIINIADYNNIYANGTKYVLIANAGTTNYKLASFDLASLTNNTARTFTLPNASGTIALTSDLSAYVTLATTQTITAQKSFSNFLIAEKGVILATGSTTFVAGSTTLNGNANGLTIGLGVTISGTTTNYAHQLLFPQLTPQTYTYPAATGTLALTSDLSGYVPYTGATGAVNLGFNLLTTNSINLDGNSVSGVLNIKSNSSITTSGAGYVSLVSGNVNQLSFVFNGGNSATFTSVSLSASRTYSLPDAGGTIALLSGTQTFTGATTFSSDLLVSGLTIGRGGSAVVGNTAIGAGTLAANTTGVFNTALGSSALASNTIGVSNTAIGANSLLVNTTGNNNTAIGTDSLNVNTTGSKNTAIGYYALVSNTTASNNIAIGYYALSTNSTAAYNLAIGNNSLRNNVGTQNIGIGEEALLSNTIGQSNTAIGFQALQGNTTGGQNFALGIGALANNTTGSGNIAIGASTLASNITTSNSIGIGFNSLLFATGGNNIAIGNESGKSITTGSNNTIIGAYAGTAAMANNIVLADGAGTIRYQWNGTNNAFTGAATFSSSVTTLASTTNGFIAQTTANSVYPYFRWVANNRSYWAAAIDNGSDAPFSIGNGNTIGSSILFSLTPSNNTAYFSGSVGIGTSPSYKLDVRGTYDAAGIISVRSTDSAAINVGGVLGFGGFHNGSSNESQWAWIKGAKENSNGNDNASYLAFATMVSGGSPTERMRITSVGTLDLKALNNNVSGMAAYIARMGSNCDNTSSYAFIVETGGANRCFIYGNGNVVNTNNSYGPLSDIKLKENIVDATPKLDDLMKVRIVNYNLKSDLGYDSSKQIGVIAQELEQVFASLVDEHIDRDGEGNDLGTTTKSVKMSVFVPMLIKAIQEQQAIITSLQDRLDKAGL